jgi:hypothetical protein
VRLKIVANIEATLDTSQANARSIAASNGWRVDGVITPYVRARVRVMGAIMRPPGARPIYVLVSRMFFRASD